VLLLKQKSETIEAATARFRLTAEERQMLLGTDKGEGLLLIRGNRIPIQVVASQAEYRLATTNPPDSEQCIGWSNAHLLAMGVRRTRSGKPSRSSVAATRC